MRTHIGASRGDRRVRIRGFSEEFASNVIERLHRLPRNVRGAIWILLSAVVNTAMTTLIKFLGTDYPASVQNFYRQLAGVLMVMPLLVRNPKGLLRTTRPGLMFFRGAAGSLSTILAFYSFQKLPLADANVLSFTRILWIVPLAALVLHEKVGPRRIAATMIGFVGVLVIARPTGHSTVNWATAAGLASALLFACTITSMKIVTHNHSTATIMAWTTGLGLFFSLPPAMFTWQWPTHKDLLLLSLMGAFAALSQWTYIRGIAVGDAGIIVPFDYARLPLAILAGYCLFGDVPTLQTLAGAAIIICSTLYITFRELRIGRERQSKEQR